jgi:outer membrane protein assembly factor BamB
VISDERVYTLGHSDEHEQVLCLSAQDGTPIWQYRYPAPLDDRDFEGGSISTPTVDDDHLLVLSRMGAAMCFDKVTGELVWQVDVAEQTQVRAPGWGFAAAPVVVGSLVLLGVGESGAALDKHTGELVWSSRDREAGYGTPSLLLAAEKPQAIFASSRSYTGVDVATGEVVWTERWLTTFGCNAADALVNGDQFFVSSGYNRGSALFTLIDNQPQEQWKHKELQNQLHTSLLYGGHIYGIDGDMQAGASIKCLEWETGQVKWSSADVRAGGMTLAGDRLIILSDSGELLVAQATPDLFSILARGAVLDGKCWTAPVLSNGQIYCRSVDGQLACVDVRNENK